MDVYNDAPGNPSWAHVHAPHILFITKLKGRLSCAAEGFAETQLFLAACDTVHQDECDTVHCKKDKCDTVYYQQ